MSDDIHEIVRACQVPAPFNTHRFKLKRTGIFDDPSTKVWENESGDFAFLSPTPVFDYEKYASRRKRLGLEGYRKDLPVAEARLEKVFSLFKDARSVLEIGAGSGAFLGLLRERFPHLQLTSAEKDQLTREARDSVQGLEQFNDLGEVLSRELKFDVICFFHVLEHITDVSGFLSAVKKALAPGGNIVVEIPSLDDPLLSLYKSEAYSDFYYQAQHPFYYSAKSLGTVLDTHGFAIESVIGHQRYGIENHLNWLTAERPGGNAVFQNVLGGCDTSYRRCLEIAGHSDAAIAIASRRG